MKKVLFVFAIAAAFAACNDSATTETPKVDSTVKVDSIVTKVDSTVTTVDTTKAKMDTTAKKVDTTTKK